MLNLKRTNSGDPDFIGLVKQLDEELRNEYGDEQSFYEQYNKIDKTTHVVIVYEDLLPAGCGAIKTYDSESVELKRMFVKNEFRGRQIARKILEQLELWATELGFSYCILEPGQVKKVL